MILTPYNLPYYEPAIRASGYQPKHDYFSYLWKSEHMATTAVARLHRIAEHAQSERVVLRHLNQREWNTDIKKVFELHNQSFDNVWGHTPMTWLEFKQRVDRFKKFYEPDLVVVAEMDGVPVGYGVTLPNINEALAGIGGRLFPLGWIRLALRASRIRSVRFILLGVLPAYTGRGIAVLIAHHIAELARRRGFKRGELSLVLDSNRKAQKVIEAFGAIKFKTFRLFEKELQSEPLRRLATE